MLVVLGADGILGSTLVARAGERGLACLPVRRSADFQAGNAGLPAFLETLRIGDPATLINCVAAKKGCSEEILNQVNAEFPQRMARWCALHGHRWMQISTNGVFAGRAEPYHEWDLPDATDPYGKSKRLGETIEGDTLCLRCSFVGLRLGQPNNADGLLGWLLSRPEGEVIRGQAEPPWTGATALQVADLILQLCRLPDWRPNPVLHFAPWPAISKAQFLQLACKAFQKHCSIVPKTNPTERPRVLSSRVMPLLPLPPFVADPLNSLIDFSRWLSQHSSTQEACKR